MTAHQAWKANVQDLETKLKAKELELSRVKGGVSQTSSKGSEGWERVEALFEEHGNYRETVGQRLQALRSEKEALQRQLHGKEDECHLLELKMQNMRRKMGA
jgi:chromosome segregation ATPase